METLFKSEYQDVYRIKSGVLLVINKFKIVSNDFISIYSKNRPYNKYSKDLRILTADYYYSPTQKTYKAGQVTYNSYPVKLINNKREWNFQIKTTGDAFSGTFEEITFLIKNILEKVCETNERIIQKD